MRRVYELLFSFEASIVLFLFAGQYKADPRFSWFPVDLTLFWFLISLVLGIRIFLRSEINIQKRGLAKVLLASLFIVYAGVTLLWSPSQNYGFQKLAFLSTLSLWSVTSSALVISSSAIRVRRLFKLLLLFSLWFSGEALIYILSSNGASGHFVEVLGGNYIGVSRVIGVGLLISLFGFVYTKKTNLKIVSTLLLLVMFFLLLSVGGRGPLVACLMAASSILPWNISVYGLTRVLFKKRILPLCVLTFLGAVGISFVIISGYLTTTISRILLLFEAGMGKSASTRLQYYVSAVDQWIDHPIFGNGLGSWPVLYGSGDVRGYPHNLFLELFSEMGIVGVTLFSLLLLGSFYLFTRDKFLFANELSILMFMLLVYALINSMISGDLADNRFLFFAIGLTPLLKPSEKNSTKINKEKFLFDLHGHSV